MSGDGFLQIGEVAERAELSLRSVRYYEEQGLVTPARRSDGGFRLYTEAQVERLLIIKQMKPLGFSVREMLELITARDARADGDKAAVATLERFSIDARARCVKLRSAIGQGELLASELAALAEGRPVAT